MDERENEGPISGSGGRVILKCLCMTPTLLLTQLQLVTIQDHLLILHLAPRSPDVMYTVVSSIRIITFILFIKLG